MFSSVAALCRRLNVEEKTGLHTTLTRSFEGQECPRRNSTFGANFRPGDVYEHIWTMYMIIYGPYMIIHGPYMIIYGPYMIIYEPYMIIYGPYMIKYGPYMIIYDHL